MTYEMGKAILKLHETGVVHNDLKFDNFMVEYEDGEMKIRIIDFALASLTG